MKLIKRTNEEISKAISAQVDFTEKNDYPHFAPQSGRCWSCSKNIYQNYEEVNCMGELHISNGYSLDHASSKLITGCAHCNRTYCD